MSKLLFFVAVLVLVKDFNVQLKKLNLLIVAKKSRLPTLLVRKEVKKPTVKSKKLLMGVAGSIFERHPLNLVRIHIVLSCKDAEIFVTIFQTV